MGPEEKKKFWATIPGIIALIATATTAILGILAVASKLNRQTRAEWASEINPTCLRFIEEQKIRSEAVDRAIEQGQQSREIQPLLDAQGAYIERIKIRLTDIQKQIEEVTEPDGDEARVREMRALLRDELRAIDDADKSLREAVAAWQKGQDEPAQSHLAAAIAFLNSANERGQAFDKLARELGAGQCGVN